jgi:hypothetical protein
MRREGEAQRSSLDGTNANRRGMVIMIISPPFLLPVPSGFPWPLEESHIPDNNLPHIGTQRRPKILEARRVEIETPNLIISLFEFLLASLSGRQRRALTILLNLSFLA